ncbi:MAG: hypothetical protein ACKOEM_03515 [Planctomycetia bacterium]
MSDTLGLFAEARQLASDLGYLVREEPLGDLPGGACQVGQEHRILLNIEQPVAAQLDVLMRTLAADPRAATQPMSRLLAARLGAL